MTLQKDFLFASLPVAGILLFMESKKFMRFSARSWLRNSGNFIFLQPTQISPLKTHVLWSRRLGKKSESHKKADSISDINLLISISSRLFRSFPFIKSRQPWTVSRLEKWIP